MAVCQQGIYVEYSVEYSKYRALNGTLVSTVDDDYLVSRLGDAHGEELVAPQLDRVGDARDARGGAASPTTRQMWYAPPACSAKRSSACEMWKLVSCVVDVFTSTKSYRKPSPLRDTNGTRPST
eukprot:1185582-Prorocentrum_minimum.AAC.3